MYDIKALYEAQSVDDAVHLMQQHPQAQIIAGGSDVLVQIREGRRAGVELVNPNRFPDQFFPYYEKSADSEIYWGAGRGSGYGRWSSDPEYRNHWRKHL